VGRLGDTWGGLNLGDAWTLGAPMRRPPHVSRRLASVPVTAALALACAVLGLAVGGAGVRLLIRDQQDARQSLARLADPVDENPILDVFRRRDVGLAHHRLEVDGRELRRLLAARADQRQAVLLVAAGLVLGFTGTLLTLPW
jgi:hypothetical protein